MSPEEVPLKSLFRMASVACGIQCGWALQFSLLTPYVEELGISHGRAGYIWLCGPITGIFVAPVVGHRSDQCRSCWGRRRPFMVTGACLIVCAVLIIGFSADLGSLLGDTNLSRPRAIAIFVVGFWIFDIANNTLQGPARALLADFSGSEHSRARIGNAFYSLFMAVGNVLGHAAGSYDGWYKVLRFTRTAACGVSCANLKSAFLIDIIILASTTFFSVVSAREKPLPLPFWDDDGGSPSTPLIGQNPGCNRSDGQELGNKFRRCGSGDEERGRDTSGEQAGEGFIWELRSSFSGLSRPMPLVLVVTAMGWFAWDSFLLFDTDWMGREVYRGDPSEAGTGRAELYQKGVSMGGIGLILNALVLGLTSLVVESVCKRWGPGMAWGISNMGLSLGFVGMLAISFAAKRMTYPDSGTPPTTVVVGALAVFAFLGAPMAVGWCVPYALTSTLTRAKGGGQGLSMGVLNLSVVIPQAIVSITSGGWDELFGGGNSPTFCVAAVAAFVSGLLAVTVLHKSVKRSTPVRLGLHKPQRV